MCSLLLVRLPAKWFLDSFFTASLISGGEGMSSDMFHNCMVMVLYYFVLVLLVV